MQRNAYRLAIAFALASLSVSANAMQPPLPHEMRHACAVSRGVWQDVPEQCSKDWLYLSHKEQETCLPILRYEGKCTCPEGTYFSLGGVMTDDSFQQAGCQNEE